MNISGGHWRVKKRYSLFRKLTSGTTVNFEERISPFTTSTSRDPTLTSKLEQPEAEKKSTTADRIVKVVQIQVRNLAFSFKSSIFTLFPDWIW